MQDLKRVLLKDLDEIGVNSGIVVGIVNFIFENIDALRVKQEDLLLKGDFKRAMIASGKSSGIAMVEAEIKRLVSELKKKPD